MAAQTPQISPDGAFWWDGQAWRPMPLPSAAAPTPAPTQAEPRPAWLADGVELPGAPNPAVVAPPSVPQPSGFGSPIAAGAPPLWASQPPPSSSSRTTIMIAAGAVIALMAGGVGFWALHQSSITSGATESTTSATAPTASAGASPSSSTPPALPLTAQLGGDYCPVVHPGDAACWKGSLANTGPAIGKLAMVFVIGGPYSNWFATHANATLSGFYTSAGCEIDVANTRILCGSVGPNQEIDAYLGGDVTTRGTFTYGVKFADISSGSPVYVNQHPDGTHDIVSWREVIS